jgi:branched-subunit amino acid permease
MRTNLIFGTLLLIGGVLLLITGANASHSLADQVSNTFYGRFTQATTWYILGGVGIGLVGLYLMLASLLTKRT